MKCFEAMPPHRRKAARQGQSGFTSIEAIGAMFVFVILSTLLAMMWTMGMDLLKKRAAAHQLAEVGRAAVTYARSQGLLFSLIPGAQAIAVSSDDLIAAGALAHPPDQPLRNAWQQEYQIYYYLPTTADKQQVTVLVLTTGGEPFSLADAPAALVGGSAGIVMATDSEDTLQGVGGGYSITLDSPPMDIPSPGPGHLGLYATLDDAALNADVLYRVAVPGQAELNQMRVNLDMSDHSLLDVHSLQFNASTVDLQTICGTDDTTKAAAEGKVFYHPGQGSDPGGLFACRLGRPQLIADAGNSAFIRTALTALPGAEVAKPPCADDQSPFIAVSPASLPVGMSAGETLRTFYSDNPNSWTVRMSRLAADGAELSTDGGSISVLTSCSVN
jgi:type II secretory pathway pseudopilin PulG